MTYRKNFAGKDISVHTSVFNIGNVCVGGNQLPQLNLIGDQRYLKACL